MSANVHIRLIEDQAGDLIDMEYYHHGCSPADVPGWPCPESVDSPVYCTGCGDLIDSVPLTDYGRAELAQQRAESVR